VNYDCYYDGGNAVAVVAAGNDGSVKRSRLGNGDVSRDLHCWKQLPLSCFPNQLWKKPGCCSQC